MPERPGWPGVRCYGSVPMAIGSGSGDEAEGSVVTARIRRSLKIAVALFALYYIALPAGLTAWTNVGRLRDIQPMYLLVGVGLEMMALVAYAQLMRVALPNGSISLFRMVRIQLATKSLTNVVPGGSAAGFGGCPPIGRNSASDGVSRCGMLRKSETVYGCRGDSKTSVRVPCSITRPA